jgi:hypothetical protein
MEKKKKKRHNEKKKTAARHSGQGTLPPSNVITGAVVHISVWPAFYRKMFLVGSTSSENVS